MQNLSISPYYRHANQTLSWLGFDQELYYKNNLKINYDQLQENGWIDYEPFTYSFNSLGFRGPEFTDEPCLVTLGCSLTFGIGLPYDSTWAVLLAKKLDLKLVNLGVGGTSNDVAFRLAYSWLPRLNPKIVVLNATFSDRFEIQEH